MVKNLKALRMRQGISQQQLATVLGVSQQSINKYENHSIEPDIATLSKLADYFDTTVDLLIGRCDLNSENEQVSIANLSEAEKQIIIGYRKLNISEKKCVQILISTYSSLNNL